MPKRAARKDGRGSRPGERRGGREKGTPNKRTAALRAALLAEFELSGGTPLAALLSVMRNPALPLRLRFDAAKKAAPFCHPKLAPIQAPGGKVDVGLAARLGRYKRLAEARNGEAERAGHTEH
jgi:hypothetical protein